MLGRDMRFHQLPGPAISWIGWLSRQVRLHFQRRSCLTSQLQTTLSRSEADMAKAVDRLGGQIMCSSSRESIMYQSSHFDQATPLALSLISDTVLNPALLPEELEIQKDAAMYEIREISNKPDMILPEVLHEVAYGGKGLGNSLMCPDERVNVITGDLLRQCISDWYRPERMVIAGAGMQHEQLVELADKYFSSLKDTPSPTAPSPRSSTVQTVPPHLLSSSSPSLYKSLTRAASSYLYPTSTPKDIPPSVWNSQSRYVGGIRHIPSTTLDFDQLYLGFEGVGIHDDDIYALATVQVLLGGGGSFSAGKSNRSDIINPSHTSQVVLGRECTPGYTPTSLTTSPR
jgi:processing peptidase subunit alpha